MQNDFNHKLLSIFDRLIGQVHPLAKLVNHIVEHIVPKTTARADCTPCCCGWFEYCVKADCPGEKYRDSIYHGINSCGACTVYGACTYC